jgi:sigma-B regulation protein RsbQ
MPTSPTTPQTFAARLRAETSGHGTAWIALGNGLGTTRSTWRHVLPTLERVARVLRYDYVGTVQGDEHQWDPRRYASLHGLADDLLGLLDELNLPPITWIGHSVGGMVGLLAAVAAPSRFARLILLGASPRYVNDESYHGGFTAEDVDIIVAAASEDLHRWVSGFEPVMLGSASLPSHAEAFTAHLQSVRPDIAAQLVSMVFKGDHRGVLPRVAVPVDVVQLEDDATVPHTVADFLVSQLPQARLIPLRVPGPVPHLTAPEATAALLLELLEAVP